MAETNAAGTRIQVVRRWRGYGSQADDHGRHYQQAELVTERDVRSLPEQLRVWCHKCRASGLLSRRELLVAIRDRRNISVDASGSDV
jgi:hypothetical protein